MDIGIEASRRLACTIACLGTAEFGPSLFAYIQNICVIDYCSCFFLRKDAVDVVTFSDGARFESLVRIDRYVKGRLWQNDPSLIGARIRLNQENCVSTRLRRSDLADSELKSSVYSELIDRLLLCGRESNGTFALSLIRWERGEPFSLKETDRLQASMPILMALVDRHWLCTSSRRSPETAFDSLESAERCFEDSVPMPLRERQVCARLAFGCTLVEIGESLGISVDTAKSYSRRAYQRLSISSQRELVIEYLKLWHSWCCHPAR